MALGFATARRSPRTRNLAAAAVLFTAAVVVFGGPNGAKAAPATQLDLAGVDTSITVGQPDTISVTARDGSGNVDTGYTGTIAFTSSCGGSCFTITQQPSGANGNPYTFVPANSGSKSFTLTWLAAAVGDQTLTVSQTSGSGTVAPETSPTVSVASTDATSVDMTGVDTSITVGQADSVGITMRNPNSDVDTNYTGTVTFSSSCGNCFTITPNNGGAATKSYTFNGAGDAGQKTFTLTWQSSAVGTQSLTATATLAGGGTATDTQTGITVNSADATTVDMTGVADPIEVGAQDTISITMRNADFNIDTNYTGTVTFSASCGDCFTITPNNGGAATKSYTFNGAGDAGQKTFTLTWTVVGTHTLTVTATLAGGGTATDSQSNIDVTPATATDIDMTGVNDPQPVNTADTIAVRAHSAQGNTDQGYTGTVTFTASCGGSCFTVSPNPYTYNGAGDAGTKNFTLTWHQTGTFSLTVTDNNGFTDTVTNIDVTGSTTTTGATTSTTGATTSTTTGATTTTTAATTTTTGATTTTTAATTTTTAATTTTTGATTTTTAGGTTTTTAGGTTTTTAGGTTTTAAGGTTTTAAGGTTTTTAAGGTTTTTAGAGTTTTTTACGSARITVSPSVVNPGDPITVTGSCFPGDTDLTARMSSDPVTLGTVRSDSAGNFRATFTIPRNTTPGSHTITVSGGNASASAVIVVGGLAVTGSGNGGLIALALAGVFAGLVLLAGRLLGQQNDEWAARL